METGYEHPSFFRFEWRRDLEGYDLQDGAIIARGGSVELYDPEKKGPMLHREFMRIDHGNDDALLAFVRKYGLLGCEGGEVPTRESLRALWTAHFNLTLYATHVHDDPAVLSRQRNETFNRWCPQHMTVVMERVASRTILKVAVGSLLAWMWLRLAQEVTSEIGIARCKRPGCDNPVYRGKNSRKEYCSDTCRAKHHYSKNHSTTTSEIPKKGGSK